MSPENSPNQISERKWGLYILGLKMLMEREGLDVDEALKVAIGESGKLKETAALDVEGLEKAAEFLRYPKGFGQKDS